MPLQPGVGVLDSCGFATELASQLLGAMWLEAQRSVNEAVKPGAEVGVIAVAAFVAPGFVFMGWPDGVRRCHEPAPSGGPLAVLVILGVVGCIFLNLIAPLGAGLGTAIRQTADPQTDPALTCS